LLEVHHNWASFFETLQAIEIELLYFSAVGFAVFGIDDLLVDLIWLLREGWRESTVYRRFPRTNSSMFGPPPNAMTLAVFIPAWEEANVIAKMIGRTEEAWTDSPHTLFIGYYPNDRETLAEIKRFESPTIKLIEVPHDGPTTKADCLNTLWTACLRHELASGQVYKAVILHDAEDFVHRDELRIFNGLCDQLTLIQLPVRPEPDPHSRWISGHYLDEFSEAHVKEMVVREAIGASLPSAGTGCCIRRSTLKAIADQCGGRPFDATSLTEDYELGLKIGAMGGSSALVRIPSPHGGPIVSIRAHFPATLKSALRQKTRWIVGIAFAGWDKTGWRGGPAERWMRWRDRRALLSAIFTFSGYIAFAGGLLLLCIDAFPALPSGVKPILWLDSTLLMWRLSCRAICVGTIYGFCEALQSIPRIFVSNCISMSACFLATIQYCQMLRTGRVKWNKTPHRFPIILADRP
jgi:bacteriophage N4 adsorption protein B